MGRLQQHDAAFGAGGQGRMQQAHFADAGLLQMQVDQRAAGPAAAGKLARERCVAGVNAARVGMRQLRRTPQRWVHCLWCGKDG